MALTRTQIDAIVTKIQGTRDLSSGGVLALKEVLYLLNDEILALQAGPYVLSVADATLTGAMVAVGTGACSVNLDSPNPGEIEFKV